MSGPFFSVGASQWAMAWGQAENGRIVRISGVPH
jgi:hypothetical protein